ncbi:MAG TPA: mercury methylation corrinoid protein HgcA, partial [Spirochaetia bacterium]|nr:mercury methylation corrinoid protein HgcA [Spirochaetia bacterium]
RGLRRSIQVEKIPASKDPAGSAPCGREKTPVTLQAAVRPRREYVTGFVTAGERKVPVVSTRLSWRDVLGGWRVRWDIGRSRYAVLPGLYAVGSPGGDSPVLVTANYKLTFDKLRAELGGLDAWILVLDTKGVNVWCAAGKGTFGTRELEQRVMAVKLQDVVSHRTLILPQLGATGVSAHEVKRDSGWQVKYGPVRARDIRTFLSNGLKKNNEMRTILFPLTERMAIAPAELVQSWPLLLGIAAASALLGLPFDGGYVGRLLGVGLPLIGAVAVGTLLFPALLPYVPFRAFSLKGALLGALWGVSASLVVRASLPGAAALTLMAIPIAAFLSMNFTGSSTFTSQPGAALEVKKGVIPMISSLTIGLGLAVVTRVLPL